MINVITTMKIFRNISRILVGIVFIFSGFVKGVDPLGTVYRMEDYFAAFHTTWANPLALYLTIFLCALEFTIGVSLLFNLWIKRSAWLLLPLTIFFTILTFFDATVNLVPECGCFGDAVKMTNLQTFLKNLVLLAFVIPIFSARNKFRPLIPAGFQVAVLLAFFVAFTGMSVYAYRHLPFIDFMGWKTGNKINEKPTLPMKFYLTFKNKKNPDKVQEFLSPNYPWNDSTWMSEWEFKSQRVEDPNPSQAMALRIEDERGVDVTATFLDNPDLQFLLVSYDLYKADKEAFTRILPLYKKIYEDGYSFICLTSATPQMMKEFKMANGTAFDFYNADDVVLKTMVRSNPGLILIKNGVVLAKWPFREFPTYEEVKGYK
jgi:uncharacterized membrane protein YphA (DoxX/SURF4 family)